MSDVVDTWSYALLGNHFHFGIKVKPMDELLQFYQNSLPSDKPPKKGVVTAHNIVSHQFQKFFQSYAQAFNKQQNRVGTLFQKPFKRCAVDPEKIMDLLTYHHFNPQYHGLCNDFRTYSWTSYRRYLLPGESKLPKIKVMEIFGGPEKYIRYHNQAYTDLKSSYYIEDED